MIRKLPNSATFDQNIDDVATPHEAQTPKRIEFKRVAVPVSLKNKEYLGGKGICCSQQFLSKQTDQKKVVKVSDVIPGMHFPSSYEKEELRSNKCDDKIPESLLKKIPAPEQIKTFKSLAHKK